MGLFRPQLVDVKFLLESVIGILLNGDRKTLSNHIFSSIRSWNFFLLVLFEVIIIKQGEKSSNRILNK